MVAKGGGGGGGELMFSTDFTEIVLFLLDNFYHIWLLLSTENSLLALEKFCIHMDSKKKN